MENNDTRSFEGKDLCWLDPRAEKGEIALSSRIRLARNVADTPFPVSGKREALHQVRIAAETALKKMAAAVPFQFWEVPTLSGSDRELLRERKLISPEFQNPGSEALLVCTPDEHFSVMVNEEDHFRIQIFSAGNRLKELWTEIRSFEERLGQEIPFAFDDSLGYLTSCPTNLGTGMRASAMLHLPGLVMTEQIQSVIQGISKLGMTVRGFDGEQSKMSGNLFQISNQSTLGESEETILDRIDSIVKQVTDHEKNARNKLMQTNENALYDRIGRAYGILRHGYCIGAEESLELLSLLRLGTDLEMFSSVDIPTVNRLLQMSRPAHLELAAKRKLQGPEKDVVRASMIRNILKARREGR